MQILKAFVQRFDYKYLVATTCVFGLFMEILDTTVVNVALPRLGQEFRTSTAMLEWVITGYLLSLAVWIPASGWFGDRFGTKRIFLFAMMTFVAGSALCGAAWNIESLACFRVLQGIGGGMLTPVGTAMLFRAFPPGERARASAFLSMPAQVAPMLGPILGGFLVDHASWRWIFYINLPVGVVGFAFAALVLREDRESLVGAFDPSGFVLAGGGLACLLFALSRGPDDGWTAPQVLGSGLTGIVCFSLLVVITQRNPDPMLDLALLRDRTFRVANLVNFMSTPASFGMMFLIPLFLQRVVGASAFESGYTSFPGAVGIMLMLPVASRAYRRLGARRTMLIGTAGLAVAAGCFLLVDQQTNLWWVRAIMLLRGAFLAFNIVSVQATAFTSIRREKTGRASSLFSTQRQMASAFAVAMLGTIIATQAPELGGPSVGSTLAAAQHSGLLAFHEAIGFTAIAGLIGVFFAFQVRDQVAPTSPDVGPVAARRSPALGVGR